MAWTQLGNAVAFAGKQDQLVWAIFGIFWTADAVLLVALFTSGGYPKRTVAIVVAIVGFILSVVWSVIQFRAIAAFQYFEMIIARLESSECLAIPHRLCLTRRLNDIEPRGFKVRQLMVGCPIIAAEAWCVLFLFALIEL